MICVKENRAAGFFLLLLVYMLAAVLGVGFFRLFAQADLLLRLFAGDVAATVFVWLMSLLFQNASVYDPYWSVAPVIMAPLTAAALHRWNPAVALVLFVILLWGLRLTVHWAFTFRSLRVQDWRYTDFERENPKTWFLINLFGIHLFPTVVVFLVMIPAFLTIRGVYNVSVGTGLGACLSLAAVSIQTVSDAQMRSFRGNPANAGHVNREGLWGAIRHPNYLGEILMWWGVYLMQLFARPAFWFTAAGPLVNTLLFLFVSIPLMEKRQLRNKPEYAQYQATTGMLFPKWFRGK